jgi:hypothetical protein
MSVEDTKAGHKRVSTRETMNRDRGLNERVEDIELRMISPRESWVELFSAIDPKGVHASMHHDDWRTVRA